MAAMVAMLAPVPRGGRPRASPPPRPTPTTTATASPVPSRSATRAEIEALCAAVGDHDGTTLEIIVPGCLNGFSDDEVDLMATLSLLANRPVNWNVLGVSAMNRAGLEHQLAASTAAAERGATVVALTLPHTMKIRLSFAHGAIIDGLPGWRELFAVPVTETHPAAVGPRRAPSPGRGRSVEGGRHHRGAGQLADAPDRRDLRTRHNAGYEGRSVGDVAAAAGPGAVRRAARHRHRRRAADGTAPAHSRVRGGLGAEGRRLARSRARWSAGRTPVPISTSCAGPSIRPRCSGRGSASAGLLSWEEAVHQLTDVPARLYGLRGRGRLSPGYAGPTSSSSIPTGWASSPSAPAPICPAGPAASTPKPRASSTSW